MTQIYPDLGHEPLIFSAAAGAGAHQSALFTTLAPGGSMTLTFVVFFYPNAHNGAAAPARPNVELQTDNATWQPLDLNAGFGSINVPGGAVNFTFAAIAASPGVFQISFTQNNIAFDAQDWAIRFTNTDGSVTAANQAGATFVVSAGADLLPWIAVPGQTALTNAGPPTLDFGLALSNLTLAGTGLSTAKQLVGGKSFTLTVPIGNYGPGPLVVTAPGGAVQGFSLAPTTALTIAPGDVQTLTASFAAPADGQTATAATAAAFTLASNDPRGAAAGADAHFSTLTLNASAGNFEIVLALDLSGSMATADAGADTRWNALQINTIAVLHAYQNFAAAKDKVAIALYPEHGGQSIGEILQPATPVAGLDIDGALAPKLGALKPIDSTPMLGAPGALGGVYVAAGDPSGVPQTNCGAFGTTGDGVTYKRNFRWMILMSDGAANVGEDPKTVFASGGSRASYFTDRNIRAITLGYGKPASGQVDGAALSAIAAAGSGHYVPANLQGLPSETLGPNFYKTLAAAMGFSFAADPDAALDAAHPVNTHKIVITDHDASAAFLVWWESRGFPELASVQLVSPLGETVTAANAGQIGLKAVASPGGVAFYAGAAALDNRGGAPRRGVWTLIVRRREFNATGLASANAAAFAASLRYAYAASVESQLSLVVESASARNYAGNPLTLSAALSLRGRPVAGATVTALVTGAGPGFENWLAAQYVSQQDYDKAAAKLREQGLTDVQALFVKAQALADKGVSFPGLGAALTRRFDWNARTGTYQARFDGLTAPGAYRFLVSATGQDETGAVFARQQSWSTMVETLPDAASTLVSINYAMVSGHVRATLTVWPRDRFGNVYLVDPAISQAIRILLSGGATVVQPLRWNLDGGFTEIFDFSPGAAPDVSIAIGGVTVVPTFKPIDPSKLLYVDEVVRFRPGRETAPGANAHADPAKALGDPSRKTSQDFVALGGLGSAEFAVKGARPLAKAVTVFVAPDLTLRPYAVEVLPVRAGAGWVEVGRSEGVTQSFSLVPKPVRHPDAKDWFIAVEGRIEGETFDITLPLAGRLHGPEDPLRAIGHNGVARVRVRDLSGIVRNPDGKPSASPGVSVSGVGFSV
jgi:hypothetical protein